MAVALTACGSSGASPEEKDDADGKSIVMAGILVGTSAHERWQKEIAMFEEYATELGVKVLIQTAEVICILCCYMKRAQGQDCLCALLVTHSATYKKLSALFPSIQWLSLR